MTKKFIACLALLCGLALAQTNTPLNQPGPVRVKRNVSWSNINGTTSSNGDVFTWAPLAGYSYSCVSITNNNPTNAHTFSYLTQVTHDPNAQPASIFSTTPPNRWYITTALNALNVVSLAPGSTAFINAPAQGASVVAVQLFNSTVQAGTPDTLDFIEVDSPVPCQQTSLGSLGALPRNSCNYTFQGNAATGTQIVISVANGNAGGSFPLNPRWHICAYSITGAAGTASAKLAILPGSNSVTCAGAVTAINSWAITGSVGVPNYSMASSPEIFSLPGPNALCYSDGGSVTGTTIAISYDYW